MKLKSCALVLIFISRGVFAGTVSGGGPREKNTPQLTLNPRDFKQAVLEGLNNGEIDLDGEKFEPEIINLKQRTMLLNSKIDLEKTIQIIETQNPAL
ncbi:MAG: hypothetical protein NTX25_24245 [Proteobacteria bacterium]|nr:hypothetical protein [Pseudomonadota bacterium]